jgi:hypothetical protein
VKSIACAKPRFSPRPSSFFASGRIQLGGHAAAEKQRRMRWAPTPRLKLGVALLSVGLIMPAGTLLVAATDWPLAVKTVVSSILLLGFEIMLIPAVALMGKDNFDRIWAGAMRLLKTLKPAGGVSRRRYTIGLYMLVGPTLYAWITSYAPSWLPADYVLRVWVNLGLDAITLASLFVLGRDFWEKVRALFLHDARAVFAS